MDRKAQRRALLLDAARHAPGGITTREAYNTLADDGHRATPHTVYRLLENMAIAGHLRRVEADGVLRYVPASQRPQVGLPARLDGLLADIREMRHDAEAARASADLMLGLRSLEHVAGRLRRECAPVEG